MRMKGSVAAAAVGLGLMAGSLGLLEAASSSSSSSSSLSSLAEEQEPMNVLSSEHMKFIYSTPSLDKDTSMIFYNSSFQRSSSLVLTSSLSSEQCVSLNADKMIESIDYARKVGISRVYGSIDLCAPSQDGDVDVDVNTCLTRMPSSSSPCSSSLSLSSFNSIVSKWSQLGVDGVFIPSFPSSSSSSIGEIEKMIESVFTRYNLNAIIPFENLGNVLHIPSYNEDRLSTFFHIGECSVLKKVSMGSNSTGAAPYITLCENASFDDMITYVSHTLGTPGIGFMSVVDQGNRRVDLNVDVDVEVSHRMIQTMSHAFRHHPPSHYHHRFIKNDASTPVWTPRPGTYQWEWQLSSNADPWVTTTFPGVTMYDLDMESISAAEVSKFTSQGIAIVCYISVGSWEQRRTDASAFPPITYGTPYKGYPDEFWFDVTQIDPTGANPTPLQVALHNRFVSAKNKGCTAVEPDNIGVSDGSAQTVLSYSASSNSRTFGSLITPAQSIAFAKWVANDVHSLGMSIGLKNFITQVASLVPYFDWALIESCNNFGNDCTAYTNSFIAANKAVFNCEYSDAGESTDKFCTADNNLHIDGILKNTQLLATPYTSCRTGYSVAPVCGDNWCSGGETSTSCASDCSGTTSSPTSTSSPSGSTGGGSTTAPTQSNGPADGATSVGCYTSSSSGNAVLTSYLGAGTKMTPYKCTMKAIANKYMYAALHNGNECWVANDFTASSFNVSTSACNMPCSGDSTYMCGGVGYQIYNLKNVNTGSAPNANDPLLDFGANSNAASSIFNNSIFILQLVLVVMVTLLLA